MLLNRRRKLLNRCGLLNQWWVFESILVVKACLNQWEWWRQGDQIGGCILRGFQLLSFAFWIIVGFSYCGLNQWLELVWINVESGRAVEIRSVVGFLLGLSDFGHPFAPCSHSDPNSNFKPTLNPSHIGERSQDQSGICVLFLHFVLIKVLKQWKTLAFWFLLYLFLPKNVFFLRQTERWVTKG